MAIDGRKHVAPAGGEPPRRQTINDLSLSINDIVPVANVTERTQVLSDLGSSAADPLYVWRADAAPSPRIEWHDGTRWHVISDTFLGRSNLGAAATVAASPAWTALTSVTATTLGGACDVRASITLANASSGAYRDGAFRVRLDTSTDLGGIIVGLPLVAGQSPQVTSSWEWQSSPGAGSHTWYLEANANAANAVNAIRAVLTVTERP